MATTLGVDVSHWQGNVDWATVRAAGYEFAIVKATESTNYVDPTFAANRARARAAGLTVGFYHFARAGDPVAEADAFVACVGSLAAGELAVLDWEVPAAQPPVWCLAWLERVHARLGVRPLVYMNQSTATGFKWKTVVAAGFPLWLAKYDQKLDDPGPVGDWSKVAMKQHSDRGSVPGISGATDLNVFYGDKAALKALAQAGDNQEDDMSVEAEQKIEALYQAIFYGSSTLGLSEGLGTVIKRTAENVSAIYRPGDPNADPGGLVSLRQEVADAKSGVLRLEGRPTADVSAATGDIIAGLKPLLLEVVAATRAADSEALAEDIVDEVAARLASKPA